MLHSTPIPAVNGGVEEVPREPAGSVSTAEQSAPTTSVPRICRVLGKQGALGLKARSGLMKIQTFCKIKFFFLLHGMDPHVPGVEIITKAEKKLTVACVVVPF